MLLLEIGTIFLLLLIGFQDIRYRAVYWFCFPLLCLLLSRIKLLQTGAGTLLLETLCILFFLALQILIVWIFFSLKQKKVVNLLRHYLGLGDILFLISIAFYFSPINYILFYTGSLLLVLCTMLLRSVLLKIQHPTIPLAGLQAIILSCLIQLSLFFTDFQLFSDLWIYEF